MDVSVARADVPPPVIAVLPAQVFGRVPTAPEEAPQDRQLLRFDLFVASRFEHLDRVADRDFEVTLVGVPDGPHRVQ